MTKIKLQKSKLELHLHELKSLVDELMRMDNYNNKTDLEKKYHELEGLSDAAMITLIKINNKIEFLSQQLEKEKKRRKEHLNKKKNYEKNNLNEKKSCKLNNLKRKINYASNKLRKSKGSVTETWHLEGWRWNKKLKR